MTITYELVRSVTAELYDRCLRKIPEDTKAALRRAKESETNAVAKQTLQMMKKKKVFFVVRFFFVYRCDFILYFYHR